MVTKKTKRILYFSVIDIFNVFLGHVVRYWGTYVGKYWRWVRANCPRMIVCNAADFIPRSRSSFYL